MNDHVESQLGLAPQGVLGRSDRRLAGQIDETFDGVNR